jgi:hypothetical protein
MPSLRPSWQIWKGLYAVLLDKEEPRSMEFSEVSFVVRLRTAVAVVILKNLSVTSYVTAEISVAVGVGRVAR